MLLKTKNQINVKSKNSGFLSILIPLHLFNDEKIKMANNKNDDLSRNFCKKCVIKRMVNINIPRGNILYLLPKP